MSSALAPPVCVGAIATRTTIRIQCGVWGRRIYAETSRGDFQSLCAATFDASTVRMDRYELLGMVNQNQRGSTTRHGGRTSEPTGGGIARTTRHGAARSAISSQLAASGHPVGSATGEPR